MTPDWNDIIYLKGKPELHVITARTPRGIIVAPLSRPTHKTLLGNALELTLLKEVLLYGKEEEDVRLEDVYVHWWGAFGAALPVAEKADEAALRAFFAEHAPMLDVPRIYTSHLRKMVKWYHQLVAAGMTFAAEKADGAAEASEGENENE